MKSMNLFGGNDKSNEVLFGNSKPKEIIKPKETTNQSLSAPIQDEDGNLTFELEGKTYSLNVNSKEERERVKEEIDTNSLTKYDWFKEETGEKHWVLYNMSCMFWNCSSLTELDLSSFSTELVQRMHHMFWNCRNLRTVDLSSFSTVNVKDMEGMFKDCGKLYKLDLSSFSTENLSNTSQMFWGCRELLEIKTAGKERFGINAPKHNDIYKMCDLLNPALESLSALAPIQDEKGNLTFTLSDIFSKRRLAETRFSALFNKVYVVNVLSEESREKCLKELEADTGKKFAWLKESYGKEHWVLYDTDVFEVRGIDEYLHIKKLWCAPHIPVNATTCHLMFRGCGNIDFSNFYTNNVVDMSYMFYNADNTIKLDLSRFDTSKVDSIRAK